MSEALRLSNLLDMHWIEHYRCHPNDAPMCEAAAAELRRLAAAEQELEALKRAISEAEPVAGVALTNGGVALVRRGDEKSFGLPLYTLKGIK